MCGDWPQIQYWRGFPGHVQMQQGTAAFRPWLGNLSRNCRSKRIRAAMRARAALGRRIHGDRIVVDKLSIILFDGKEAR